MNAYRPVPIRLVSERSGIALPLALLGLVVVSLMVTTALVTSSTEVALSMAHQDARERLFSAEDAIQKHIGVSLVQNAANQRIVPSAGTPIDVNGETYTVSVTRLEWQQSLTSVPLFRRETFSLVGAHESGRGRSVGTLLSTEKTADPFSQNIDSGAMIGTNNLNLPGNSYTISGRDTSSCATGVENALHLAADVETNNFKEQNIDGEIVHDTVTIADFASYVLGGKTPNQVASFANIKWGSTLGGRVIENTTFDASGSQEHETGLNWGCPAGLISGCESDPDNEFFPMVAIQPESGQEAHLTGHGQGFLIVLGDARLNANFEYSGVIVVVGDLTVNGGAEIHGSLVALSSVTLEDAGDGNDDALITGSALVQLDQCAIEKAADSVNEGLLDAAEQTLHPTTLGWFEVLR